jgi:hypothetical protein
MVSGRVEVRDDQQVRRLAQVVGALDEAHPVRDGVRARAYIQVRVELGAQPDPTSRRRRKARRK